MALNKIFSPSAKYKLIRLGKNNDGGYLVGENSILQSNYLISFGLDLDWSFEKSFKKKNINILCFDDKLSYRFILKKILKQIISNFWNINYKDLIFLIKKLIEFYNFKKILNFKKKRITYGDVLKITNGIDNIFFKIDIEGSEYRILDELIEIKNKINGIVIEFHDVHLHQVKIQHFIKNIGLELIHIHPNNYQGLDQFGNPYLLELTFEKKPIVLNKKNILPHEHDMKNNPYIDDINLTFQ
jgi:hypothetical protein